MSALSAYRYRVLLVVIVLLAAALRWNAAARLPLDFDEPVYFRAGQRLAAAVRAGDFDRFVNADSAPEHPGLVKLLYAANFLRYPPAPEVPEYPADLSPERYAPYAAQIGSMGTTARLLSALFGVFNVLLVAVVSPAAGALLAVHTYTVKYTSQIYLEALPMFTATVAVLSYVRAMQRGNAKTPGRKDASESGIDGEALMAGTQPLDETERLPGIFAPSRPGVQFVTPSAGWWALSAVALGLTAAGKYIYAVAGLAIAADVVWRLWSARRPRGLLWLVAWGGLALLVFYAANPTLWPDPAGRLLASLSFHAAYAQGAHVAQSGYPWWQPFVWLFTAQPARWHPGVIFTPLDGLTAVLGLLGIRHMWAAWNGGGRVIVLWWLIGLVFLLAWSTKWPQYSLIMTVPVCLCAAEWLRALWSLVPSEMKATADR